MTHATPAIRTAAHQPSAVTLLTGDCLDVCPSLATASVDMIYIDPPYFTRRDHAGRSRTGSAAGAAGPTADNKFAGSLELGFTDRWQGGRAEYLHWLEARIGAMLPVLKPHGTFLLHLDWHVVHYAKVLCDKIFGDDALINELIWHYQTGGASKGRFSRKHDTILLYARGPKYYFDGRAIAIPRGAGAMKRARCLTGARIKLTDTHKNPDDVLVVPALNPMAVERTGYPTQKPVALLEKLVLALCPAGGTVGDFFCGSGTALCAAARLNRDAVGCDANPAAIAIARGRLEGLGCVVRDSPIRKS